MTTEKNTYMQGVRCRTHNAYMTSYLSTVHL